ncbi:SulP family inorganic anion transporter [Chitinimonas lacunae]|uniref:SulP family inorganic anion transporter n=1 Tax=Chitinimonas lacunae TaxID=1963018 RepID=A0ABV8MMX1_9NEIS
MSHPPDREGTPLSDVQALRWWRHYRSADLPADLIASITLTALLIPQSLAYAQLAGLPPEAGLYASMLPPLIYALFGTSRLLAVGPVALASLMTATSLAGVAPGSYALLAAWLALLSGLIRVVLALLRFGFIANLLSHSVIGGFIAGSALLIVLGQVPAMLGLSAGQAGGWDWLGQLARTEPATLVLSLVALLGLLAARHGLPRLALRQGWSARTATLVNGTAPVLVIIGAGLAAWAWGDGRIATVGAVPAGLPPLGIEPVSWQTLLGLLPAALAISLVGFVDSMSVAQQLALKRREKIEPDRELLALGLANVAAGLSGGYPVSGSFGRSAANGLAGARSQIANILSAGWMVLVALGLGSLFVHLPRAVLAATIVAAVASMFDWSVLRLAWRYDRRDAAVFVATAVAVPLLGVLDAIGAGVLLSLTLFFWRTGRPHMAVVGRVPGTEHYRNVRRHQVETVPGALAVRIDESLYFGNIRNVEHRLAVLLADAGEVHHLVLILSAVNAIDVSALQALDELNRSLGAQGVALHLAEVKGPVMDKLIASGFIERLQGRVHLSTHAALQVCRGVVEDYVI